MAAFGRRPRNRAEFGKVDADDVAASDRDPIARVEREQAVTDPQRLDDCLSDEPVPVLGAPDRSPDLQVNGLRATTARRVDVPGDDEAVLDHPLCRIDEYDRLLYVVLVFAPNRLVSDTLYRIRFCQTNSRQRL